MKETVAHTETGLEIAVIGLAGRFPGAKNIADFWANLKNGVESISFLSAEELAGINPVLRNNPNFINTKGGVLDDIEYFDAPFFNYTPLEAEHMLPQIRILHECLWTALEDAGYDPECYGGLTGLYAGLPSADDWGTLSKASPDAEQSILAANFLNNRDYLSTIVSYKLNLIGPSFVIHTACSTSLVAIHLACQGLLSGDCDMALASGLSLSYEGIKGYIYQEGGIDSPDGHCRPFDASANGTRGGDGAGVVVLKRLEDAVADRDHIYAVIKGSAINNDGNRKVGFTAPSIDGQAYVIRKALKMAEIDPETIRFIEGHGTATPLGDVTEVEALKIAFNSGKKHFCSLGSVKTNVGHLGAAAGVAGFIKAVLALKYRLIPPNPLFKQPNPKIDFENSPFYVNTCLNDLKNEEFPLHAGVSSFGIGGTNAHVVLEEYGGALFEKTAPPCPPAKTFYYLFLLSAKTQTALDKMTENLGRYLEENPGANLDDIAYTLHIGRKHFPYRRKLVSHSIQDTIAKLSSPDSRNAPSYLATPDENGRKIIFMFPGLGPQYTNMGLDLYQTEPVFHEAMDHCFNILIPLGYDLKKKIYPDKSNSSDLSDSSGIHRFDIAQLVIFILEYALAKLIMSWGIKPHAMIGYSFGEYSAACISGVFSPEDILHLLVARGKLISELPPGMMLSVPLPVNEVKPLVPDQLAIAIDNGSSCVVSGPTAAVKGFEKEIRTKKVICTPLDAAYAIHSPMMGPILGKFTEEVAKISLKPPQIPYISTVTGTWIKVEDAVSPKYWARQLRETVRFAQGIQNLHQTAGIVFLEVGPGRDIGALVEREINENGDKPKTPVVNLVRQSKKETPDDYYLLDKIGLLWLHGVHIDWHAFHPGKNRHRVPLPTYPFEKLRFWRLPEQQKTGTALKQDLKQDWELANCFYIPYWKQTVSPLALPPENEEEKIYNHYRLIFLDKDNDKYQGRFALNLVNRLKQEGYQVITVAAGETFSQFSHQSQGEGKGEEHHYIMNPTRKEDYEILIRDICNLGMEKFPAVIIHLWTLGTGNAGHSGKDYFQQQQDVGYYSLLYLAQALVKHRVARTMVDMDENSFSLRIEIVSDHLHAVSGDEEICAEKTTITGLCKTIPQEYPNITCRSLDIKLPADPAGGSSPGETRLLDWVMAEFTNPVRDLTVAYRGNSRWVHYYGPLRLESRDGDPVLLRRNGVYLITGGLGSDSFIRARYLAETFRARLVLTGRTPLPEREYWMQYLVLNGDRDPVSIKIKRIQELESLGAEVLALDADVADELDMRLVMQEIDQRFGVLNGVIHAAGITDVGSSRIVMEVGQEESEWHFRPKVYGLYILEKILSGRNLDFCLLTSSIASITAGIGLSAYTSASIFMDAFVRRKNSTGSSFPWIGLNWVGSDPDETVEAFKRVMSVAGLEQVVFCQVDLQQLIRERIELKTFDGKARQGMGGGEEGGPVYERPALSTPYMAPRNAAEQKLADIWQRFFGIDKIGVTDDIFDLGGDSLKAMNILGIVQKELNFSIPLKDFFDNPTIEGAAKHYVSAEPADGAENDVFVAIEPAEKKEYYILSSAQRRMYLFQQMNPGSTAYNSPVVEILEGYLDIEKLEQAFKTLIERHETLRTSIIRVAEEPVQKVHDHVKFEIEGLAKVFGPTFFQKGGPPEAIIKDFVRPFDLLKAPLLRLGLIKLGEDRHLLLEDMHHIITDAVSSDLFEQDFNILYGGGSLPGLRLQYKDYSEWQNSEQQLQVVAGQEAYWLRQFEGDIPALDLPTDFPRPVEKSYEGYRENFELGLEETRGLKALGVSGGATLFMTLLALLNVLLAKLSGREDIVIGTPAAGRGHMDLDKIIGVFINTMALRSRVIGRQLFSDFLREVKTQSLDAFANADYPFEALVEKISVERDISRNPLFDVLFLFLSVPSPDDNPEEQGIGSLKIKPYPYEGTTAKFDLTLIAIEKNNELECSFEYCTRLFKEETIRRFIACFKRLVSWVISFPGQLISELEIIPEQEKQQVLYEFNNTGVDFPGGKAIHQLFEEQVARTPDRVALLSVGPVGLVGQVCLTYRLLNEQSNRLAGLLIEKGVGPDDIAAIMMERSVEMVIGVFGILKTGGAYLPIEPNYPQERIDYMLKDSGAGFLINEKFFGGQGGDFSKKPPGNVHLAYVIYTSGSTGLPKGTAVEHGAVVNLLFAMQRKYPVQERDVYLLKTSYMFDVSVTELFGWFFEGGKLVVLEKGGEKDPVVIFDNIERHGITHINFVPSMFSAFVEVLGPESKGKLGRLKYIFLAGEALWAGLVERFRRYGLAVALENIYGPTEGTVYSAWYSLAGWGGGSVPIGKPLSNVGLLVLDRVGNLQPVGVPGELCITGVGLARGYLNNPELTAEKFNRSYKSYRTNIFYKTGDLARWLEDGNIEFLGRLDYQVKVRGFRIELGEIEGRLLKHPGVKDAAVIVRGTESGDKSLCAYVVGEVPGGAAELKEYLSMVLPHYMVPADFIFLAKIPLNVSGKIDRKALPEPGLKTGVSYIAPANVIEEKLVEIWSEILGIEKNKIGVEDNFFLLGGHSLRAASMAAKIHRELGFKITLTQVFKTSTIRGLARGLEGVKVDKYKALESAEEKEYYALSPAQKRLYILQQIEPGNIVYNMPDVFYLEGNVDAAKLAQTFKKLISRHESLRTSFMMMKGEPVQRIQNEVEFEIEYYDLATEGIESQIQHFIRPFDLSQAPLLRVGLLKVEEETFLLLLDMHHIITDGASTAILINDFTSFYEGKELAGLKVQYRDFAQWQNKLLKSGEIKQQEEYWLALYADELPILNLPGDYPRPTVRDFEGDTWHFEISGKEAAALRQMASAGNATLFQVFLTVYYILLAKLGGQEDIAIGTPVLGRTHPDLSQIIGMFVNTLALRNFPNAGKTFREFLAEVKECVLEGFENQDYQFEDLVEKEALERDVSRNPFFDVMFIFQEQGETGVGIPGLKLTPYKYENKTARFDLTLAVVEFGEKFHLVFEYAAKLFKKETIERFGEYFKRIAAAVPDAPGIAIADLEFISETEKKRILFDFNDTAVEYPGEKTIHGLFADQVERTPGHIVLVGADLRVCLSYRELHEQSDALAHSLRQKGVAPDSIVGIMMGRSIEMIIGLLGILKSGGAYLPIDPEYPKERSDYMLKDSAAQIMVNANESATHFTRSTECIFNSHQSNHLAYVIYTSGTTGRPKGVAVEHRGVVNTLLCRKEEYQITPGDVALQLFSFSFDGFVASFFTPIISGAKIILLSDDDVKDIVRIKAAIVTHGVTHMVSVPPLYRAILENAGPGDLRSLKVVTLAGDVILPDLLGQSRLKNEHIEIAAEYGVTEASVMSTIGRNQEVGKHVTIGKPVRNTRIYILDRQGRVRCIGAAGELCISGVGVARGYLNNPELTVEKFGPQITLITQINEIQKTKIKSFAGVAYKTGDLARWLSDGSIEFLGRIDNQVKIRGFRIELGEIETRLIMHQKVKDAVVIAAAAPGDAKKNKLNICAYVVPIASETLNMSELREYLAGLLPAYMIPTFFVQLERIPLTANGKINRRALPSTETRGAQLKRTYVAPKTDLEKTIAAVWKDILGVTEVGLHDNFFEIGGNSLKIMELTTRLTQVLNRDIPVVELFKYQTIASCTNYLSGSQTMMNGSPGLEARSNLIERAKRKQELQKASRRR